MRPFPYPQTIRKTKKNGKFTKHEKFSKSEVRPKKNSPGAVRKIDTPDVHIHVITLMDLISAPVTIVQVLWFVYFPSKVAPAPKPILVQ